MVREREQKQGEKYRWWMMAWHSKTLCWPPKPDKILLQLTSRLQPLPCELMLSHAISPFCGSGSSAKAGAAGSARPPLDPHRRWLIQLKWGDREPGPQSGSKVGWDCQPMCSGLLNSSVLSPCWSSVGMQITPLYIISPSTQIFFSSLNIFKTADLKSLFSKSKAWSSSRIMLLAAFSPHVDHTFLFLCVL